MSNSNGTVNKVIIIGNLGQDPEIRYMPNGQAVANISVATTERWKDQQGQPQEKTEWHRVTMYRRLAEITGEYLRKGSKVFLEGKLQTRKWQAQDGQDRYTTEVIAEEMQMLDSRGQGNGNQQNNQQAMNNQGGNQGGYQQNNQGGNQQNNQQAMNNQGGYQQNNQGGNQQNNQQAMNNQGGYQQNNQGGNPQNNQQAMNNQGGNPQNNQQAANNQGGYQQNNQGGNPQNNQQAVNNQGGHAPVAEPMGGFGDEDDDIPFCLLSA